MEKDTEKVVCINCGHPVPELYRKYGESVIKMTCCANCHQVADKYIEFEPVVILVDVVLLTKSAYRHILFNGHFKNFWKLFIILSLMESYMKWMILPESDTDQESEKNFYISGFWVIMENLVFYCSMRGSVFLLESVLKREAHKVAGRPEKLSLVLWKSIILASLGKFLFVPIVIWQDNSSAFALQIHSMLVMGYFLLSLICSCSGKHGTMFWVAKQQ
ncbi:protein ARV1 [Phlebotomus argentipes]|uniref:protein ARV1 n=1 Tax=Phlebotomus argentipes TaxID=94469 RepID=UPI00289305A0|nr:protein ARV1 [Phlebotomus argentipes]XP_059621949.1 protein ARV1 [Phlebotomus argentipes]